jgi:hypothetical protein
MSHSSAPPVLTNGDFEAQAIADEVCYVPGFSGVKCGFKYLNAPDSWTGGGTVIVVSNGNKEFGGLTSGSGSYFSALRGTGSYIQQEVTGLDPGQTYEVRFKCGNRPDFGEDETVTVMVDGRSIWETTHPTDVFVVESAIFVARGSTAMLRFENDSPQGDKTIFLDQVVVTVLQLGSNIAVANPR